MTSKIEFISPVDGDMLHANDGILTDNYLQIQVKISAPTDSHISINGTEAELSEGVFTADVKLHGYENLVQVLEKVTGETRFITVYRLDNFLNHYRLSIDDNIWFLRNIYQNQDAYESLFDDPYLSFLKQVNVLYGTKIHLNLFYETEDFNLSMFPDKYKPEWKENAGWLTLSFHALAEFPDTPYISADYCQVKRDCDLVIGEILRFAGPEVMSDVTTIHWGEATKEASRVLRDAGYRGQLGYFNVDDDQYPASYYLSENQRRNIKQRFVWKDNSEDIVFVKTSIVIDTKKLTEIIAHLESHPVKPPYLDLLVHEQYFYPFYFNYQPDYRDKILTAVKWASDNGYQPAFLGDCVLG